MSLLLQGAAADPVAWRLFWKSVLGDDAGADGKDLEELVSVFEEGVSQIVSANLETEVAISAWIKQIIRAAKSRGLDQGDLSERILTRQIYKQVGQREQGRPQTFDTREKILAAALEG